MNTKQKDSYKVSNAEVLAAVLVLYGVTVFLTTIAMITIF